MINTPSKINLAALEAPVNRTVSLIKFGVLAVSVAAAIPTAKNLYYAWHTGVPYSQVEYRLAQAKLWESNYDCKIDYRALSNATGQKIEVGSCPKTRDISIKISSANGQVNYEWIAFNQLPKPSSATASLSPWDLIVSQAFAAEQTPPQSTPDTKFVVAQASESVICQAKMKDAIVRVVKDGNKCVKETVSIFKGSVEKREEVPCDSACPVQ